MCSSSSYQLLDTHNSLKSRPLCSHPCLAVPYSLHAVLGLCLSGIFTGFTAVCSFVGWSGPDTEPTDKLSAVLPHTHRPDKSMGAITFYSLCLLRPSPSLSTRQGW